MADENIVVGITANSNFSDLVADINKVSASLARMQQTLVTTDKSFVNQVAKLNAAFSSALSSSGQFSTHFVSLQSDAERFGKSLDSGKLKLRDYFNTLNTHVKTNGGLIRDLAKQQTALQNAVIQPLGKNAQGLMQYNIHVARGIDEIANKTKIASQQAAIMNKVITQGANQLINWGKNTQWAGRQLTVGLTVPMLAFGKAAADAFKTADEQLIRLTKVYGGVAAVSTTELGKVRKEVAATAKELSSQYGASFNETLGLAADIAATGKTGNELLGSIKETTRLAVLGEVDRQDAMKATLAIQTAFKQNTDELGQSINFLNAVENQTSTTLADLVEAIPKAGPIIKGLGGNIKDLALYLTAMKEGGITAAEGANALKSGLASLINPTNVAVNKFKTFGIDLLGIVNNNAGDVTGTLLALQSALDQLDPLKKQQALEQLFGKFQFARMNALFNNLGRQGSQTLKVLDLMKASSQDLANVAGRELAQVTESASGKYKRALESLKADLAGVGEQFLNINTNLLKFVDSIVKFAGNLPGPIKAVLGFLGGLTAIAGPLIMLTGVLGNFFGYIIKGVSHFRALFKGAEGWKMLTPEILAAQQAGNLMEKTFYNDAKAATVLKNSIANLINELSILESKAAAGSFAAGSQMTAAAAAAMAAREVNPQHPLVGSPYTRASAHMVPRGQMSQEQRAAQTFFGMVPSSIPVNQRIGENPMVYSHGDLPSIPGLTAVETKKGPVSTGVIASEAAKWHTMNATLAMMSKSELAELKKNVMATGVATQAFTDTFESVLPAITGLTNNAATESAAIVAKLRSGELTVEAARAEIVALNLQIEQQMGQAATALAGEAGRTINLQKVPTLNQPVVDTAGKSNMRELFKKAGSRNFINKLAGVLGVRTSGAGYNVETTRLKKFNSGGYIYTANDGSVVPGPNVNADVVPAMLTPGEFVVNAKATSENLPLLQAINGRGTNGPGYNAGSNNPLSGLHRGHLSNDLSAFLMYMDRSTNLRMIPGRGEGITGREIAESIVSLKSRTGMHPMALMDNLVRRMGGDARYVEQLYHSILKDLVSPENRNRIFGGAGDSFEDFAEKHLTILKNSKLPDGSNVYDQLKRVKTSRPEGKSIGLTLDGKKYDKNNALLDTSGKPIMRALLGTSSGLRGNIINKLLGFSMGPNPDKRGGSIESHGRQSTFLGMPFQRSKTGWATYGTLDALFQEAMRSRMKFAPGAFRPIRRNSGGIVPGYARGGRVAGMLGSMALGTAGYMAGSQIGQNIGGDAGSLIGGMLGSMAGSIPLGKLGKGAGEAASGLGKFSAITSKLPSVLKGTLFGVSRLNIAVAGLTTAAVLGYKAFHAYQESQRVSGTQFGMSADAAKNAGYNITDYAQKMKDAIAAAKALKERNTMLYESMTQSNTPLKMTIEQYKKLRSEVKSTMGDYVKLFDKTKGGNVSKVAADLKAQFMSMGDSAETATAKIYALIAQSNKSGMARSAIGSAGFRAISDATSAAGAQGRTFTAAQSGGTLKAQASALYTTFQGIDNAITSAVAKADAAAKSGKATAKSFQEVANSQMNAISKSMGKQRTLSTELIAEIKKENPELAKVLNSTDNITSAWYKYKLVTMGVGDNLDKISGKAAKALYDLKIVIDSQTKSSLSHSSAMGSQYTLLGKYTSQIKALQKAARGQSVQQQIDDKTAIKNLQKQIDLINKAADDKIKALQKANDAENAQLEIQKAQLEYQQAVARGDRDSAAQAQIRIRQLMKERQLTTAEDRIRANAEAATAPLQAKIDAINNKQDKMGDAAALAGEKLTGLQTKADTLRGKLGDLEAAVSAAELTYSKTGKYDKTEVAAVSDALKALGSKVKASDLLKTVGDSLKDSKIYTDALNVYTKEMGKGGKPKVKTETVSGPLINSPSTTRSTVAVAELTSAGISPQTGTKFKAADGNSYEVKSLSPDGFTAIVKKAARGGIATAGKPLVVGDGGRPELFIPRTDGIIVPDLNRIQGLSPSYNVPNSSWGLGNTPNSSGGVYNNMYNVKIELNGTNLTADDVYNKFEQKLAVLNAKQGRNKVIGGR